MIRLFVRFSTENYARWRAVYDEFGQERQMMGVVDEAIYQEIDDPNVVTLTHDFQDVAAARAFTASPRLGAVIADEGSEDARTLWFGQAAWSIPAGLYPHYWGHEYETGFAQPAYWSS